MSSVDHRQRIVGADDVITRLSLFRLANVSLFLVEMIVIGFFIY